MNIEEIKKEINGIIDKEERGGFIINVLGIVHNPETGKILIGRRENDPYIKQLSWCFPGGMPCYGEDIEECLKKEIWVKTNLWVKVSKIIHSKTYPEKRHFYSTYYYCPVQESEFLEEEQIAVAREKFIEVKWVKPTEVVNYFTTSLHPKVMEFLETLEEFSK